jgi:hypothetical protein
MIFFIRTDEIVAARAKLQMSDCVVNGQPEQNDLGEEKNAWISVNAPRQQA